MSGGRWFRDLYRDAVWESETLTADQKAVAETYARHARDEHGDKSATADLAWLKYDRIQAKAGVRRRQTVAEVLIALEEAGWLLEVARVHRRPTLYRLTIPGEPAATAGSSDVGTTEVPTADHGGSTTSSDAGTTVVPQASPVVPTPDHGGSDVRTPPLEDPPSRTSPSSVRPADVRRIVAATGASDDEARAIIDRIKGANKIRKPFGVYLKAIPDDHLVDHLTELRADTAAKAEAQAEAARAERQRQQQLDSVRALPERKGYLDPAAIVRPARPRIARCEACNNYPGSPHPCPSCNPQPAGIQP